MNVENEEWRWLIITGSKVSGGTNQFYELPEIKYATGNASFYTVFLDM